MPKIADLILAGVLEVNDGYRTKQSELSAGGFRILRAGDVQDTFVQLEGVGDHVSEKFALQIGRKVARAGDVIITTKGTVGRVAMVGELPEAVVYSPQISYLRVLDEKILDRQYLMYWLRSPQFIHQMGMRMFSTDMAPYISLTDMKSVDMPLPSRDKQKAISNTLKSLDDKVESNQRVSETAIGLARTIFNRYRNESNLVVGKYDLLNCFGGGTPSTKSSEYWGGEIRWATPSDVTTLAHPYLFDTGRAITAAGLDACNSQLLPVGSVLMTSRATIGAFAVNQVPTAINQGFIAIVPRVPREKWWILHHMEADVDTMKQLANGATFLELSRKAFKEMPYRCPSPDVLRRFHDEVDTLHAFVTSAQQENAELFGLRDVLLPGLMEGSLTVPAAEGLVGVSV